MSGLDRLWAGWRTEYIEGVAGGRPPGDCLFCALQALPDVEALILDRTEHTFTVMNAFPYTSGHLMVLPARHEGALTGLDAGEAGALMAATQRAAAALEAAYHPQGMNVGMNLGRSAGAGIPEHLHVHLVPRWGGDTNFMTAVAETRVLPETLGASYERLRAVFAD